jgi:hypothetical protein
MKSKIIRHRDGRVALRDERGRPSTVLASMEAYIEWDQATPEDRENWLTMFWRPMLASRPRQAARGAFWNAAEHEAMCPDGHSLLDR